MAEVQLNSAQFRLVLDDPVRGPGTKLMLSKARKVLREAVRLCPVDNGDLRDSLSIGALKRQGNELVIRVGTDLEYGLYVHEGTGIYGPKGTPIRPTRRRFLKFEVKTNVGRPGSPSFDRTTVYAKEVRGVRPRPFLRDALRVL